MLFANEFRIFGAIYKWIAAHRLSNKTRHALKRAFSGEKTFWLQDYLRALGNILVLTKAPQKSIVGRHLSLLTGPQKYKILRKTLDISDCSELEDFSRSSRTFSLDYCIFSEISRRLKLLQPKPPSQLSVLFHSSACLVIIMDGFWRLSPVSTIAKLSCALVALDCGIQNLLLYFW